MLVRSLSASVIQAAVDDAYWLPDTGADLGESVPTRTNGICYRCTLPLASALGFQRSVHFSLGPHKAEPETGLQNKKFISKVIKGHRIKAAVTVILQQGKLNQIVCPGSFWYRQKGLLGILWDTLQVHRALSRLIYLKDRKLLCLPTSLHPQ